jgi:hypothetical protein
MKRAAIYVLAIAGGLVLAGLLMALAVPMDTEHATPALAIGVTVGSVAACLGLALVVLRRE